MSDAVDLGSKYLQFEQRGPVAWVTINGPERRNALTSNMYFGIRRAVDRVNASRTLHALVITGTGDVFAPGGEMGGQNDDGPVNYGELLGTAVVPFNAIRESSKPVIASGNALCRGGGLLITMLSDVAIASNRAVFGAPELLRGVADTSRRDPARARRHRRRARHVVHRPDAERIRGGAVRYGLVGRVVPHEKLAATTDEVVRDILRVAPRARVALKRLMNARYAAVDKITFDESVSGKEVIEGFHAFVEKRDPAWIPDEARKH